MMSTLRGVGEGGGRGSKCSGRPILIFFIKENWMNRHNAQPNINMLLTRNLPFDYDVRH